MEQRQRGLRSLKPKARGFANGSMDTLLHPIYIRVDHNPSILVTYPGDRNEDASRRSNEQDSSKYINTFQLLSEPGGFSVLQLEE